MLGLPNSGSRYTQIADKILELDIDCSHMSRKWICDLGDEPEGYKYCSKCRELLPYSDFSLHPNGRYGLQPRCKDCHAADSKQYSAARPPSTPEKNSKYLLKRKYGLTLDEYDDLVLRYGGVCGICKQPSDKVLVVDHDHTTGEVRGVLCSSCNTGIGFLGDTIEAVEAALAYLKNHREVWQSGNAAVC